MLDFICRLFGCADPVSSEILKQFETENEDLRAKIRQQDAHNLAMQHKLQFSLQNFSEQLAERENKVQEFKSKVKFAELQHRVIQWAKDRQIIPNSTPAAQLMKTMSELGELADATLKLSAEAGSKIAAIDGVGDVLVTLIIYCELLNICPIECLDAAYAAIKDRRGYLMPNGVFVKENASEDTSTPPAHA
ncbi:hypothetical protein EBZ39_02285 [bacterium]|nr:hypothetical protein [bacterium]